MPTLPPTPVLPRPEDIYDIIMATIEPDLVSTAVKGLKAKYAGETAAQKKSRKARYLQAFAKYKEAYKNFMADLHAKIARYRTQAFASVEQEHRATEEQEMNSLEASFAVA